MKGNVEVHPVLTILVPNRQRNLLRHCGSGTGHPSQRLEDMKRFLCKQLRLANSVQSSRDEVAGT